MLLSAPADHSARAADLRHEINCPGDLREKWAATMNDCTVRDVRAVRLKIPWYNYRWWGCALCTCVLFVVSGLLTGACHASGASRGQVQRVMNSMSHWVSSNSEIRDSKYQSTFQKVAFLLHTQNNKRCSGTKCCFVSAFPGEGEYCRGGAWAAIDGVWREKCQQTGVRQTKRHPALWLPLTTIITNCSPSY